MAFSTDVTELFQLSERTAEKLSGVKDGITSLINALSSGATESLKELTAVLKAVADAAKEVEWREPIGESGILELTLDILDRSILTEIGDDDLKTQCLRLLANVSADEDSNRERLVSRVPPGLSPVIKLLLVEKLRPFALPALHNICLDYDPAQRQAIKEGTMEILIEVLKHGKLFDKEGAPGQEVNCLFTILEVLASQDTIKDALDPSSVVTILDLFTNPQLPNIDIDAYNALLSTVTSLLNHTPVQNYVIQQGLVEKVVDILRETFNRFHESPEEDKTAMTLLWRNRKQLLISLSDLSGNPLFMQKYPLEASPLLTEFKNWLYISPSLEHNVLSEALQAAACIVLGNVATSDEACNKLVRDLQIHLPLIEILGDKSKDAGTVFSAVGMLRNLSLPAGNKPIIGKAETEIWKALEMRWSMALQQGVEKQVLYAIAGFVRLLVKGCFDNARQLLEPLAAKEYVSSTSTSIAHPNAIATRLSLLLQVHSKVHEIPTKTEISRTLVEILRNLASARGISDVESIELQRILYDSGNNYLNHGSFVQAIAVMIEQDKYPVIRSEGLFGFGLIATGCVKRGDAAKEGCRRIWEARGVWWKVFESVEKEKADIEAKEDKVKVFQGKDRGNSTAILVELRRTLDTELSDEEKVELERLIAKLSSVIGAETSGSLV